MFIEELYEELRCGKTQLCHNMSLTAQLPHDMNNADGKVASPETRGVDGGLLMSILRVYGVWV